jgi:hypothetical protein
VAGHRSIGYKPGGGRSGNGAAEASGILLTANPINGARDEIVLDAAWGLGQVIVGGVAQQAIRWITDRVARELSSFTDQQSVRSPLGRGLRSGIQEVERIGSRTEMTNKTRVAVLGTLADLHREPIVYNLACLACMVEQLNPDLLFVELQPEAWEAGDVSAAPIEYREALIPLAARTDIVIVPIQGTVGCEWAHQQNGRGQAAMVRWLDGLLRWFQRRGSEPRAIHSGGFGHICHTICLLEAWVGGSAARRAWNGANRTLLENVLAAVRRDPGVRVLITVDCRRWHQLAERLRHVDEIELVPYWEL